MKTRHHRQRSKAPRTWSVAISRRYAVPLPVELGMNWRLGQRVFFSKRLAQVVISAQPKGLWSGRLISVRIRRHVIVKRPPGRV